MFLVLGVLAAVLESRRTGSGQVVDVAMSDAVPLLLSLFHAFAQTGSWRASRSDNMLDGGAPYYRCYECAGGGYVAVGALEPAFYRELLSRLNLDLADCPQNDRAAWPRIAEQIAVRFLGRTRDEWATVFADSDACVTPVLTLAESTGHPHHIARGTFERRAGFLHPAPAPRFGRTPGAISEPRQGDVASVLDRWSH
jgi:alpha-methylacyl-CoA racemase